jgi:hypothetical protein
MSARDQVIQYYDSQIWLPSMPKGKHLSDQTIKDISETLGFSSWMLNNSFNEVVLSVRRLIQNIN